MFTTRSKRRIKVPKELWPEILKRINADEDLHSIADAYECTIESLSYIMKMTKTRGLPPESNYVPSATKGTLHLNKTLPIVETIAPSITPTPSASPTDLTDRLETISNILTSSLISWQTNPSHDTKTAATEALHELRKILVRVEIILNSKPQS